MFIYPNYPAWTDEELKPEWRRLQREYFDAGRENRPHREYHNYISAWLEVGSRRAKQREQPKER